MSLIQEALQRQKDEEARRNGLDVTPPSPDVPPPPPGGLRTPPRLAVKPGGASRSAVPEPSAPSAASASPDAGKTAAAADPKPAVTLDKRSASRPWRSLALILLIVLLLIGAGVWMILYALRHFQQSMAPSVVRLADPPAATDIEAPVTPPGVAGPDATVTNASEPPPAMADPPPSKPVTAPVVVVKPSPTKPVVRSVKWPTLNLTGIVGRGRNGAAILNGKVIGVGESQEGVTVVAVREQGVDLELGGDVRYLKIGGVLP